MNISKGKLILLVAVPLAIALAWGIITTNRLSASRTTLQQTQITLYPNPKRTHRYQTAS